MKNSLFFLAAALGCQFTMVGQSVTKPDPDKFYKIQHVSGLYLTDVEGYGYAKLAEDAGDNSQIVRFVPVEGMENVYNIERVRRGMFYGSNRTWQSTIISCDHPFSRFEIAGSDLKDGYVTLRNLGLSDEKGKTCVLGSDNNQQMADVYTDKSGTDVNKHLWTIVEAERYDEPVSETPADVYPDKQLEEGDPRANAYPGYKLVFAEEFSIPGKPDAEIWQYETGFKRNQEHQYYDGDNNSYIQDGVLVIEARNVLAEQRRNPSYSKGNTSWPSNIGEYLKWTSGSMQTRGSWNGGYTWNFGIYEVRAKVPQMTGCWPAIWSTGMQYEWPYGGEIDIMEYYGNAIHGNVCWGNGGRWSAEWNSQVVGDAQLGKGWGDEFHTWKMIWDYDHMELWCDEWLVNVINLETTVNQVPTSSFDHSNGGNPFRDVRHMLWLNLAIGGQNGGNPENPPYPNRYLIDYARVYQKIGTDGKAKYHVDPEISAPTFSLKDGEWNPAISGIEETVATPTEAEAAEYYSLQGIRLDNPEPGQPVLCNRGGKITKVIVK